jgi:acetyl esterase
VDLDPVSQAVVNAINASGVVPFRRFDPVQARSELLKLRAARPAVPTHPMASVWEESVAAPDGSFKVRVLKPRETGPTERLGAVIYLHGGGFFAGGLDETDLLVRQIAKDADVVVVNVEYHLSPEVKFPVAVNDAYAALEWTVAEAPRLGIDPARLVMAGDSAGGNLTIVTALQSRDRGGPAIAMQVVIYPSLDLRPRPSYESRARLGSGELFLMNDDIEWMLDHYFTDRAEGNDWRASPILAQSFAGLPPALVVTASHDPLVDEGKLYADRLKEAGVEVEYVCFNGTFHGFVSMASVIPAGARAMELICDRIRTTAANRG